MTSRKKSSRDTREFAQACTPLDTYLFFVRKKKLSKVLKDTDSHLNFKKRFPSAPDIQGARGEYDRMSLMVLYLQKSSVHIRQISRNSEEKEGERK